MEVVIRTYIVSYTDVNHRVADANPVKDFGTSRHALLLAATFLIDILLSENEEARSSSSSREYHHHRFALGYAATYSHLQDTKGNLHCKCLLQHRNLATRRRLSAKPGVV